MSQVQKKKSRKVWMYLKLDHKTPEPADLEDLADILYPDSERKRECFVDMVQEIVKSGESGILLKGFIAKYRKKDSKSEGKYYPNCISDVWLGLLSSGLARRRRRGQPVRLSRGLSSSLQRVVDYWDKYVSSKTRI